MKPAASVLALLLAGCAGSPAPASRAVPAPAADSAGHAGPVWRAVVSPFQVTDSAGRLLSLPFVGGFNVPRPQLADLDGDGDLDLLVQEWGGRMLAFERVGDAPDGLPDFRFLSWQYGGLDVGEWSRFADLDGDGDLDLLAELPYSYIRLIRNTGTDRAPRYEALPDTLRDVSGTAIFADRQNIPQVGDVDCNGRPDLLIGRVTGIILRYEADGERAVPPRFRLQDERWQGLEILTGQGSMHGANTMALADADEDGDLDLFWGDFFEAGLLWFENIGTCQVPTLRNDGVRFPLSDPVLTSGYNAPAFGDLDRDGKLDLIVGVLGGAYDPNRTSVTNLHYYSRTATGGFTHRTGQLLPQVDVGSETVPALLDLDGDGDLDLLLGNKIDQGDRSSGRIYLLENVGIRTAPRFRLGGALPISGRYHPAPAAGDLDGDGRPDLLVGGFGATVAWYRDLKLADSALVTIPRGSNTVPALGDLDGDGDLDLLVGEASGGLNAYRNEGTPRAPKFTLITEQFDSIDVGRRSAPALADFDADGDLDLLIGSEDTGLHLYRNQGTPQAARFVADTAFHPAVAPMSAPAAADLDGDGVLELVVGTIGGGALLLKTGR